MTNEEALALLEDHEYWANISAIDEMAEVAIKAIRKQIPTNVIDIRVFTELAVGNCPTCGCMVIDEGYYCENCGQALKWERE